jgi:hypothetical protein
MLINLLVFFSLVSIHEFSHVAGGMLFGCKIQKAILIDSNFIGPYTEFSCASNNVMIFISSFLITSSFSLLFLVLEKFCEKDFFS